MGQLSPVVADWLLVAVGLILTLVTAFFVATEFAFLAVDPARVAGRAANGDKRAALVKNSISNLSTQLSGTQVGITLSTIMVGYTTQKAIANLVTRGLGHTGMALAAATALGAVVALSLTNL